MALPTRDLPGPIESEINVAPMIDVLLVLLVVFLVAQAFARQVLPVALPVAAQAPGPVSVNNPVVLDVTGAGFLINGQPVPDVQLEAELRSIYSVRTAKLLFVRPSADETFQQLTTALDRARAAGVEVAALLPAER